MVLIEKAEGRRRFVALGFVLLSLLAAIPLVTVKLPPILDYPNHMARMYLIAVLPGATDLARYYRIAWDPLPDLAFDAVVPWLMHGMSVEVAMQLALGVTLLALAGGCIALHRAAFHRWSLWPLFAFLLLYNRVLLWGFLNYLAGLALMLWALAAWVAMERKPVLLRVAVGAIAATAIYLAHLAAFGCYAVAIVAFSLAPHGTERVDVIAKLRRAAPALVSLLPGIILFLDGPTSGASTHFGYGNPLRKFDLPVSVFDNYNRIFDGTTFAVVLIAVIAGLKWRAIILHDRLRWSLAALLVAFVIVPTRLLSASGIDHRLPIAIALVFVAVSGWGAVSTKRRQTITGLLLALLLVRMAVIETVWLRADREYDALRPMFDKIAPGAKVTVAAPVTDVQAGGVPLYHFATLAVIERHAFVDTMFADPHQQPLRLQDCVYPLWAKHLPAVLWQAAADGALPPLDGYDDMIIVDPQAKLDPAKLPGTVTFAVPRMMLVHLSHPARPSETEHAQ